MVCCDPRVFITHSLRLYILHTKMCGAYVLTWCCGCCCCWWWWFNQWAYMHVTYTKPFSRFLILSLLSSSFAGFAKRWALAWWLFALSICRGICVQKPFILAGFTVSTRDLSRVESIDVGFAHAQHTLLTLTPTGPSWFSRCLPTMLRYLILDRREKEKRQ